MHFLKGFLQTCILFAIVAVSSTAQTLTISASAPWQNSPYYIDSDVALQNGESWLIKGDGEVRVQSGSLELFGDAHIVIEDGGSINEVWNPVQIVLNDASYIEGLGVNTIIFCGPASGIYMWDQSYIRNIGEISYQSRIEVHDDAYIESDQYYSELSISTLSSYNARPLRGNIMLSGWAGDITFLGTKWEITNQDDITLRTCFVDMGGENIFVDGILVALDLVSLSAPVIYVNGLLDVFSTVPEPSRFSCESILGSQGSLIHFHGDLSAKAAIGMGIDARIETAGEFLALYSTFQSRYPDEWKGIYVHGPMSKIHMDNCEILNIQYPYSAIELLDSPNPENSVTYCTISNAPGTPSYQSTHGVKVQYTQRPNFSYLYMCHNNINGFDNGVFNNGSVVDMDCCRLTDNLIGYNCIKGVGHYYYNAVYDNVNVGMRFSGISGFFVPDANEMILNEVTNNPLNVELRDGCTVWASRNNLQATSPYFSVLAGTSSIGLFDRNYYGNPMPPFIIIIEPGAYFTNNPTTIPYSINPDVENCHPDLLGGEEGGGSGDGSGKLGVLQVQKNAVTNYPNPFNPSTVIEYTLDDETFVKLTVFNALGEVIVTLVDEVQGKGTHSATFTADQSLPSGTYLYTLTTSAGVHQGTMLLTK